MRQGSIWLGIVFVLYGCCAPISPTVEQVKHWASGSIPAGSSEAQVRQFCTDKGFGYSEMGGRWATASRRVGGCDATHPVVWMNIQYDEDRRVRTINVYGGSMLP